jgi:hypothetical protein
VKNSIKYSIAGLGFLIAAGAIGTVTGQSLPSPLFRFFEVQLAPTFDALSGFIIGHGNSGPATSGTFSGNTTEVCTVNGALTPGHLISVDANGNCVDDGISLTGKSGSTTEVCTVNGTLTNGHLVSVDALGNCTDSGLNASTVSSAASAPGTSETIASGSTVDLGTAALHNVSVTGTTTINSFGSSANISAPFYLVGFASALQITQSASIQTPFGANLQVAANSWLLAVYLGSGNWAVTSYSNSGVAPGTVAFFDLSSCPTGWLAANGSSGTVSMVGRFARGLDTAGTVDHVARTLGSTEADTVGPFTATGSTSTVVTSVATSTAAAGGTTGVASNSIGTGNASVSVSGGSAETAPKNIALLACQKS